jgi:hypothetical protein
MKRLQLNQQSPFRQLISSLRRLIRRHLAGYFPSHNPKVSKSREGVSGMLQLIFVQPLHDHHECALYWLVRHRWEIYCLAVLTAC